MWNKKIKRDKADELFSRYIRLKAGRCEYCGKLGTGNDGIDGLEASHYKGRRCESVRFDLENVDCFCHKCHSDLENEKGHTKGIVNDSVILLPKKYTEWKQKQLGARYNALILRAAQYKKKDRKFELIRIKELLNQLP